MIAEWKKAHRYSGYYVEYSRTSIEDYHSRERTWPNISGHLYGKENKLFPAKLQLYLESLAKSSSHERPQPLLEALQKWLRGKFIISNLHAVIYSSETMCEDSSTRKKKILVLRLLVACVTGVYKGRRLGEREKGRGLGSILDKLHDPA